MGRFLGFDIAGTKCAVVLGDENGCVFRKIRFETTTFSETLAALLEAAMPHSLEGLCILPAGLGDELGDKAALSVAFNGYSEKVAAE